METIALFGGSFDPPHAGHIAIVEALREFEKIDKIIIMPTFLNPFKSLSYAPATLRLKWLKEIFRHDKKIIVSDYEVKQAEKTPTIQSVQWLLKSYKKIYLVLGADSFASLHTWHRYDELKEKVEFIIASRDKIKIPDNYICLNIDENISSSVLRKNLDIQKIPSKCATEIAQFYKENNAK